MKIPANVILLWPSTVASIPTNWTRETALDAKFPKAWGAEAPGVTGGASAHQHTGNVHTHARTDSHSHIVAVNDYNSGGGDDCGGTNTDPAPDVNHGHDNGTVSTSSTGAASDAITYPTSANNNHPPYFNFLFLKANTGGAVIAADMIALFNSATIPSNWLLCTDGSNGAPALGNKYIRGATTAADGGSTGGSLTHTHALDHSHSTTHSHTGSTGNSKGNRNISNDGGSGSNKVNAHSHSVTLNSATVSTDTYSATLTSGTVEPAYKKVLAIQRQATAPTSPKGIIGLWIGAVGDIPKGWKLCNGQLWDDGVTQTPDLQNYYVKIANATSELGNSGGSNTHEHTASNAHAHSQTGAHTHTASIGSVNQGNSSNGGNWTPPSHSHSVNSVGNNSATLTWDSQSMSAQSSNNEPEYYIAAYIQLTKLYAHVRMLEC